MGCDGGTIPKRDELVKSKKKEEERDRNADLAAKWQFCALSSTRLRVPIVACQLGRLYNKDAVIEFLLNRDAFTADVADHVKSLKDVTELKLTEKKDYSESGSGGDEASKQDSPFICPVVGLEMNGKYRFCYLRKCGCVISERALKEVKSENCHRCGALFDLDQDVVVLNATAEETDLMRIAMNERKSKAKLDKKDKKRKHVDAKDQTIRLKEETSAPLPSASASSSNTDQKSASNVSVGTKGSEKEKKYEIAKDPNRSEVFKSLFTTHETAKKKPKSNWVTHNPLYY